MDCQQQFELYKTAIIAVSGLLCALIGGGISYLIATRVYKKQKRYENQRIAISKFEAISISYRQCYHDYFQTEITGRYLEHFNVIHPSPVAKAEFMENRKHAYALMNVLTKERKEFVEILSMIELSFGFDKEIEQKINAVRKFINNKIETNPVAKNIQELDSWKQIKLEELLNHAQSVMSNKSHELLAFLKRKLN